MIMCKISILMGQC